MRAFAEAAMTPFRVLGIDHIVLRCKDLAAMHDFYCKGLGFEVAKRNDALGLVHLRSRLAMIDLVSLDGPLGKAGGAAAGAEGRNMDHLCLRVDPFDVNELTRYFEALGVAPAELRTRFGAEGDGLSFYIRDPEGNRVEIKGPASAPSPA
jgi:catechol 2,3-dioxygenase-like lactoylglutathione lyase family enzyme